MTVNTAGTTDATPDQGPLLFAGGSTDGFEVTPDGKAFSFHLSTFTVHHDAHTIGAIAEHHEWVLMAVRGSSRGAEMRVTVKGTVDADPRASANLVVIANGSGSVVDFPAGSHTSFDHSVTHTTTGTEDIARITIAAFLEREVHDPPPGTFGPDVHLTVTAVHAVLFDADDSAPT